jgi:signal transduction histidine kinase
VEWSAARSPASSRVRFLAGVLAWAVLGLPTLLWLLTMPSLSTARVAGWLAAYLTFGIAFSVAAWPARTWAGRSAPLLLLQTAAALVMAFLGESGFEGAFLAVVAGQLPFAVPVRAMLAWVLLQTAGLAVAYARLVAPGRAVAIIAGYLSLQGFAIGAAYLAASERRSRLDLGRVNAELLATQGLLAENTRVAERLKIARELHDSLGHHLAALSVNLDLASHHVVEGEGAALVRQAHGYTRLLLADVRGVVGSLRDEGRIDLTTALRTLVAGIPAPQISLSVADDLNIREPAQAHALFRCVQEIVTNTLRHASARHLWIELTESPEGVAVHARDDGQGVGVVRPGHGLAGMRERLENAGGHLEIESEPGKGFAVRAFLPRAGATA